MNYLEEIGLAAPECGDLFVARKDSPRAFKIKRSRLLLPNVGADVAFDQPEAAVGAIVQMVEKVRLAAKQ